MVKLGRTTTLLPTVSANATASAKLVAHQRAGHVAADARGRCP